MSITQQLILAKTPMGRIQLHLLALRRDSHYAFHYKGIMREVVHGMRMYIYDARIYTAIAYSKLLTISTLH